MPWEIETLSRTLFIEVMPGNDGKKRYAIHPLMRVTRNTGESFLEPIPFEFFGTGDRDIFRFDAIEYIDQVYSDKKDKRGDLGLTNFGDRAVRRGA